MIYAEFFAIERNFMGMLRTYFLQQKKRRVLFLIQFATLIFISISANAQWVRLSSQLTGPIVTVGNTLIILSEEGVYRSTDFGNTWQESTSGVPSSLCSWTYLLAHNSDVYLTTGNCGIFYSRDSGQNWENAPTGNNALFQPVAVGDTLYMDALDDGLWESGDRGVHWTSMKASQPSCHFGGDTSAYCWALDSNYLFAGATPFGGVYRSKDTAVTWNQVLPFSYDTGVFAIAAHGRFVLAGAFYPYGERPIGMYRSTDWGATWQLANNGLPLQRIAVLTTVGSTMFTGGNFGVYYSPDDGEHWIDASADTAMGSIYSFTTLGPYLYASGGGSTWRRPLSDLSGVTETPPLNIAIQSYPNPFSQSTTISFTPETSGYADVSIVTLLGVEVAHLFSGELGAGEHSFTWDASGIAPGSYWCIARFGGRAERIALSVER